MAAKIPKGQLPQSQPLQPAPQFVHPNYQGSINFDAEKAAQLELRDEQAAMGDKQQADGLQEQSEAVAVQNSPKQELAARQTGIYIAAIICAMILLVAAWAWFIKRWMRRNKT